MRITLNELRTLIRSEVRKASIRNRPHEEIKKFAEELRRSGKFQNLNLLSPPAAEEVLTWLREKGRPLPPPGAERELAWASLFIEMGAEDSLFRQTMYPDWSDKNLIDLALELVDQVAAERARR